MEEREITEKSLDGTMSSEEYYRLNWEAEGMREALMKNRDIVREAGREIPRERIFGVRTFREVRKSEDLSFRTMIEMALTGRTTELDSQYRDFWGIWWGIL